MYTIELNGYKEPEHWAALNEKNLYLSYTADYVPNPMGHMHKSCELLLVEEGGALYSINGVEHKVGPGDLLIIGSMDPHNRHITSFPFIRYGLTIMPGYLESLPIINEYLGLYRTPIPSMAQRLRQLPEEVFSQIKTLFLAIGGEYESPWRGRAEMTYALILQLTIVIGRVLDSTEPASAVNSAYQDMMRVRDYIDENYAGDLSLTKLAEHFYLGPSTVSRRFGDCFGVRVSDYINSVRVMNASRLLENTDMSVTDIAFEVGYQGVNTLIRQFSAKIGSTPLQYRKQYFDRLKTLALRHGGTGHSDQEENPQAPSCKKS